MGGGGGGGGVVWFDLNTPHNYSLTVDPFIQSNFQKSLMFTIFCEVSNFSRKRRTGSRMLSWK